VDWISAVEETCVAGIPLIEYFSPRFRKWKVTADMIVLVVTGEEAFRFGVSSTKAGRATGSPNCRCERGINDEIAQGHDGSAASGFGAHRVLPSKVYCEDKKKKGISTESQSSTERAEKETGRKARCDERGGWNRNL